MDLGFLWPRSFSEDKRNEKVMENELPPVTFELICTGCATDSGGSRRES